jgi:ureidoglycolate lyase
MRLQIELLTPEAFAPFGLVVDAPTSAPQASGPGWQWWGETVLMEGDSRPYGIGYLRLEPAARRFDWAERHMRSPEMIVPLGGACLVYAGPADYPEQPDRLPELDRFRVFEVREGQGVILNPGVWHGAPLAHGGALNAVVLLKQGTGATDVSVVRFEDRPVEIVMSDE